MGEVVTVDREFEVEARRISAEEWSVHWPQISRQLDTIPQYWSVYWTKEYINHAVMNDEWQAWGFGDMGNINVVVLTQVIMYPANAILQMVLAFGNSLDLVLLLLRQRSRGLRSRLDAN